MSSGSVHCPFWANYPIKTKNTIGGFSGVNPSIIVCGGKDSDMSVSDICNIVTPKKTEILTKMLSARNNAASLIIKEKILWVSGGNNGNNVLSSSEYIDIETRAGPEIPEALEGHKMIDVNDDLILFIGGSLSSSSTILTSTSASPKEGCASPENYGDGYCHDENNNEDCDDGGDCCGDYVINCV